MYCVRCGDKIEKNELVCDKCGLRFTITNANGTTVYINQTPNPVNVKKKKKKERFGWIIALVSLLSIAFAIVSAVTVLTIGVFLGMLIFVDDTDEQVVVNNPSSTTSSQPSFDSSVSTYHNIEQPTETQSTVLNDALREPFTEIKGDGTDTVTVMIYMNGSDLESRYGAATSDLKEMLNATLSDNVNVVIQTGGTKKWKTDGISAKHSQRFIVKDGKLELIEDDLPQLDITDEKTLKDFIVFCDKNYPADRNILILWDHGGGAVYGYGVDENLSDEYAALTLDEIQRATRDSGVKFEMIGFDACLMGGIETACALCDSADYLVASEDFEPGDGWEYQNWLTLLGYNSSTPMTDVGKVIVDDFIKESISQSADGILSLIDLRYTKLLYSTWTTFAYANEDQLLTYDYTMSMQRSGRAMDRMFKKKHRSLWDWFDDSYTMETYCYAVDIMALASTMDTDESKALENVMRRAVLYCSSTSGDSYMTGLSVTLPYGDSEFYNSLDDVFTSCGFDSQYISFLYKFVDADYSGSYDWDNSDFNGWDTYDDNDSYDSYDWDDYDWNDYYNSYYEWDWNYDDGYDSYYNSYYDDDYCDDGYCDDGYYDDDYYDDWGYDDGYYDDGYYDDGGWFDDWFY